MDIFAFFFLFSLFVKNKEEDMGWKVVVQAGLGM